MILARTMIHAASEFRLTVCMIEQTLLSDVSGGLQSLVHPQMPMR